MNRWVRVDVADRSVDAGLQDDRRLRKDNGPAIRATCRQFGMLCHKLELFSEAIIAIGGSKLKAVNNRDKNFTPNKLQRRIEQIEASIDRYLLTMDGAHSSVGRNGGATGALLPQDRPMNGRERFSLKAYIAPGSRHLSVTCGTGTAGFEGLQRSSRGA